LKNGNSGKKEDSAKKENSGKKDQVQNYKSMGKFEP
jgi:hypothetical protein